MHPAMVLGSAGTLGHFLKKEEVSTRTMVARMATDNQVQTLCMVHVKVSLKGMLARNIGVNFESTLTAATAPPKTLPSESACQIPVRAVVARGMSIDASAGCGLAARRRYGSSIVVPDVVSLDFQQAAMWLP